MLGVTNRVRGKVKKNQTNKKTNGTWQGSLRLSKLGKYYFCWDWSYREANSYQRLGVLEVMKADDLVVP